MAVPHESEARGHGVVEVDIHGQRYPIRSGLDPAYVRELAAYVDRKVRLAAERAPASDTVGLAVLVALNLADEVFRAREHRRQDDGSLAARARDIERLVDHALALVTDERP